MTKTRLVASSATRSYLKGPLIDDRIRKTRDLEQRRYPAHGLRVAETDEPARQQTLEQVLCRGPARDVVEIDQNVTAKDHVELPMRSRRGAIQDVDRSKADGLAQLVQYSPARVAVRREVPLHHPRRQPHQGTFAVK